MCPFTFHPGKGKGFAVVGALSEDAEDHFNEGAEHGDAGEGEGEEKGSGGGFGHFEVSESDWDGVKISSVEYLSRVDRRAPGEERDDGELHALQICPLLLGKPCIGEPCVRSERKISTHNP